jgi:Uma2 family endonuclease
MFASMTAPAIPRATYDDVLKAPSNKVAEILDGTLHLSPRPAGPHCLAASALGGELATPFHRGRGGPGGWLIVDEPELHLGGDILVPDLAGWRRARLPKYPKAAFVTLAPDWVCEVLSPRTQSFDRVEKRAVYAREGVQYLWLVDPLERTLETYELLAGRWTDLGSFAGEPKIRAVPFDAIELELGALWEDVEPPSEP